MPDTSVDVFNERIADILNTVCKEHKIFYCIGDLNIDLFKYDVHKPTSAILDTIYAYNVFPLITKPTRVTETAANLIDHILTKRNAYYKAYRNRLHHILRTADCQYYQDLIKQHKANIKKSWQVIKSIINKQTYCPVNSKFKYNGDVISDGKIIANIFNIFFVNVGESLAKEIPSTNRCPSEYIRFEISEKFFASTVTEDEIYKMICNLRTVLLGGMTCGRA